MSKFMISGIYLRCLLERRGEQLLEHTALGPGMELLFDEEMSSSITVTSRHSLLVASPLLSLLPPAQHHQQRGQREGESEHGQSNLRRSIVFADIWNVFY